MAVRREGDFEVDYNTMGLLRIAFDAKGRSQARVDLGFVGDQLAEVHVGRFEPQKNHRFLIEEFAELARLRHDAVFVLVGSAQQ